MDDGIKILKVSKEDKTLRGNITLPYSKSISNRALILQAVSGIKFPIINLSGAEDTRLLTSLLQKINTHTGSQDEVPINCNNAGTVYRFLTSLLSITPGKWILTGNLRMKERPVGILVDALIRLGADIQYPEKNNFPPLIITGTKLNGGSIDINAEVSSQFISALLMIAPVLENGLTLRLKGKISSVPYINMTLGMMKNLGISYEFEGNKIKIISQKFVPGEINTEPDWSSAAFWYELVSFSEDGEVFINGLTQESLQGDSILPDIFEFLGVRTFFHKDGIRLKKFERKVTHFEFDFINCPDLAQAVIVCCAGLGIDGTFTGLNSLRIKETDRLKALYTELFKLGFNIQITRNAEFKISNSPPSTLNTKTIFTYGDHRMAMAFAPLSLLFDSIHIEDPNVVVKSYPEFWEDLRKIGFKIE